MPPPHRRRCQNCGRSRPQIDKVDGLVGQLSAEQRKALAGLVNPLMPSLNQLFDKVLAIPGVSEVLKPTIEALRAKLAVLTA